MTYSEFKEASRRGDSNANDTAHFFSQSFAAPMGYLLYRFGMSPNQITLLFLVVGFASALAIYWQMPVLCYFLWRTHIVLDMADGTVARATKNFSNSATGFDRSNHIIINTSLLFGSLSTENSLVAVNFVVCAFYLNYFFSRNYFVEKQATRQFSLAQTLAKNAIGLEGYIAVSCLLMFLGFADLQIWCAVAYGGFFLLLFLRKLHLFTSAGADT